MLKDEEIFGLLGPNGAGKTSLISMITGLYQPDQGNSWIGGYNIIENIEKVHLQIGVCPQFDLLWPDLTIKEHLLFYARIKGISRINEEKNVKETISNVGLQKFSDFRTKNLSGKI